MVKYINKEIKSLKTSVYASYEYLRAYMLPITVLIYVLSFITLFNYCNGDVFGSIRIAYFVLVSIGIKIILILFVPDNQPITEKEETNFK